MKISTKQLLKILYILSWIIFIGVCIEAGGSIFSAFYTLVINSANAKTFWVGNDLSGLYAYDRGHFFCRNIADQHYRSYEGLRILPGAKNFAR